VCDVWLQDEGYDRTTEVLSRVSQFGVVQWLGTDVPLQLHTFQSLVPAIVEVEVWNQWLQRKTLCLSCRILHYQH